MTKWQPIETQDPQSVYFLEQEITKLSQACRFGPLSPKCVVDRTVTLLVDAGLVVRADPPSEE